jgi:hypothetical protein
MYIRQKNKDYINPIKDPVTEADYEKWNRFEYENAISKLARTYNFTVSGTDVFYFGEDLIEKK